MMKRAVLLFSCISCYAMEQPLSNGQTISTELYNKIAYAAETTNFLAAGNIALAATIDANSPKISVNQYKNIKSKLNCSPVNACRYCAIGSAIVAGSTMLVCGLPVVSLGYILGAPLAVILPAGAFASFGGVGFCGIGTVALFDVCGSRDAFIESIKPLVAPAANVMN